MTKRYDNVVDMARDLSGDKFADELKDKIERRTIITQMMVMRAAANVSLEEMDERTGLPIESVETLEDKYLLYDTIERYADALGFKPCVTFVRKEGS